ncbi:MAG: riboflavin synthase [Planctomycetota bacterium]|nr:riboflavin synthase [Planctomycetota bacterium]
MFTGLIEARVPLRRAEPRGQGMRLALAAPTGDWLPRLGASVAVSGACLTMVGTADPATGAPLPEARPGADLLFDLSSETLARTWFARARPGRLLNLERALLLSDRLDGHLVAGHVDGLGRILAIVDTQDGGRRIRFEVDPRLSVYLVDKGSVTLDGISLTVVDPVGPRFDVAVIPQTLAWTSLGEARVGDEVHVEGDLVGKWVLRGLEAGYGTGRPTGGSAEPEKGPAAGFRTHSATGD